MCLDQFRLSQLLFHISARSLAVGSGRRRILAGVHYVDSPTPPVAVAPFPRPMVASMIRVRRAPSVINYRNLGARFLSSPIACSASIMILLTDAKRRQFISNGCHLLGVIFYCRDRDLSNKMQIANKPSTGNETSR
ncbi:uncharacterized protein LOC110432865 isoform X1 [Sorghum bicolor]|uniref:uncharacterized protein LOC110431362 isoform X1 n=1 Tax=Sorghum bicolor TaxID=4558 RepID=UPI0007F24308|nr:uncharacterized protein LOC110431362 isoform X1 [Sorghum bicolor]XP_021306108.1 uncharacterized protein LOC110431362 isoform X1 [Sorghum bicolor]XP_021306109.1 uncharacterized protein LOC110431362 isoform X1 [Sorghum bicolor]XP_021306110.1 uncharacterized protein LOC110431362 isoform X1 [Sorghum bicolor]XP_021309542.1 uncharacterized protein LOC110432865 isoform X1 [Sorghum bicolor]XP_021309546.1 uncharacterized protein LOC110432865 isoform X1 [Sorghum bicolor]XP_021309552.1 uncharacterize|eukprot:XP_021306107.1 uncharacterized protein LOC110431362 isoform X1 [Sorghum bicolor]